MRILITGVPGVGKTTIAKKLAEKMNIKVYNEKELVNNKKIVYENNERIVEIDLNELKKRLAEIDDCIVDGIAAAFVAEMFDFVILLKEKPEVLRKRMKARNYNEVKIEDNIFAQETGFLEEIIKNKNVFKLSRDTLEKDVEKILEWMGVKK